MINYANFLNSSLVQSPLDQTVSLTKSISGLTLKTLIFLFHKEARGNLYGFVSLS